MIVMVNIRTGYRDRITRQYHYGLLLVHFSPACHNLYYQTLFNYRRVK